MPSENSSPMAPGGSMAELFRRFEAQTAAGDAERLAAFYAPAFLMAGPAGAQVVKAGDLAAAIPKRRQLFDAAGCRSTTLLSVDDTRLDGRYSLVRTTWQWTFARADGTTTDITLPASYVVDRLSGDGRIVCYVNDADITAIMRERGLLPS